MTAQRNDPCPCGSGAKYKRCCLDREVELQRLLVGLERIVEDIGDETYDRDPEWVAEARRTGGVAIGASTSEEISVAIGS